MQSAIKSPPGIVMQQIDRHATAGTLPDPNAGGSRSSIARHCLANICIRPGWTFQGGIAGTIVTQACAMPGQLELPHEDSNLSALKSEFLQPGGSTLMWINAIAEPLCRTEDRTDG
jgi:hypothetical protein